MEEEGRFPPELRRTFIKNAQTFRNLCDDRDTRYQIQGDDTCNPNLSTNMPDNDITSTFQIDIITELQIPEMSRETCSIHTKAPPSRWEGSAGSRPDPQLRGLHLFQLMSPHFAAFRRISPHFVGLHLFQLMSTYPEYNVLRRRAWLGGVVYLVDIR